jgi:hypothetical protein
LFVIPAALTLRRSRLAVALMPNKALPPFSQIVNNVSRVRR